MKIFVFQSVESMLFICISVTVRIRIFWLTISDIQRVYLYFCFNRFYSNDFDADHWMNLMLIIEWLLKNQSNLGGKTSRPKNSIRYFDKYTINMITVDYWSLIKRWSNLKFASIINILDWMIFQKWIMLKNSVLFCIF